MDIYLLQNVTTISDLLNGKYYIDNVFFEMCQSWCIFTTIVVYSTSTLVWTPGQSLTLDLQLYLKWKIGYLWFYKIS